MGIAGSSEPKRVFAVDGATVFGYVFLTSLKPTDVGFGDVPGVVGLAITSHPDFDDTPFFDENNNGVYNDEEDGAVYHSHWVVLEPNPEAEAGLAVKQVLSSDDIDDIVPPTAPMAMYLDSPGFDIVRKDHWIQVVVPTNRMNGKWDFSSIAVTARMLVDATGEAPLLKVEEVYSGFDGDGNPTFPVQPTIVHGRRGDSPQANPFDTSREQQLAAAFDLQGAEVTYIRELESLLFTQKVRGRAGGVMPEKLVTNVNNNGATVYSYTFPTTLHPADVGFGEDVEGIVALAITSHPDFDDTPLWDENNNGVYGDDPDDGGVYHTHWVILVSDSRAETGFAIKQVLKGDDVVDVVPATAPNRTDGVTPMMYLDSPGHQVIKAGDSIHSLVPLQRMNYNDSFAFGAVTARLQLDTTGEDPLLTVEQVFDALDFHPGEDEPLTGKIQGGPLTPWISQCRR